MASGSSLRGAFISFVVVGALGMLIRYMFGGDGNRSKIHQMFIDVLHGFWWAIKYILVPLMILALIGLALQKKEKDDES